MLWVAQETSNAVSLDAVWRGAGAVLLGAVIAAVVAIVGLRATLSAEGERQDRQLAAERQRLDDQLEAERKRLDRQLEHERELTDLAELRKLLDEMMGHVYTVFETYSAVMRAQIGQLEEEPPPSELEALERRQDRANKAVTMTEARGAVLIDALRLAARLPKDDDVVDVHQKVVEAMMASPSPTDSPSQEHVEALRTGADLLWSTQIDFISACRTVIGTRLPT